MEEKNITLDQVIAESFDFSNYSEEEKQKLIDETSGMIMETSLLRSLDEAGEEMQEKFNTFLETDPNEESMSAFIGENFPNFGKTVIEEINIFKEMGSDDYQESAE